MEAQEVPETSTTLSSIAENRVAQGRPAPAQGFTDAELNQLFDGVIEH